ncbi:hypothetical protein DCAR_0102720 [Daucus carota subsp. sativus]|uniref:Helicase MOV-10-like beta-barrel domain-containing protein n=1 Tax=Daucus carota subsp. sativus TaxID=79200 RepID=A0A166H8M9_DAUCS|nr:PREDICTED: probable RNA helicase SDE3 [Daucus carota subsp. sativus]WOG83544.1 hypothetical protein DCAR_0102720 [Daucus carota subsp. sativus]
MSTTIKKDYSLLYHGAADSKDANTACIVSGVIQNQKPPRSSLKKHLSSLKSASNSTPKQAESKCTWVPKASSSRRGVSQKNINLISTDAALEDLEKPLSEPFIESNLSSSSPSYSTATPHPPEYPLISVNPASSFGLSKSTNRQTKAKCIQLRKDASTHGLASEDRKYVIKMNTILENSENPDSSPTFSPKSPPIFKRTQKNKTKHILVKKRALPLYIVPKHIKKLIKRDIVPIVLRKPLSPLTYKDYFATLLYAEDYYFEKWDGFEMLDVSMRNVSLELHKAVMHRRKGKSKSLSRSELSDDEDVRTLVQFEIDSIPGKRPFLLSKDFAYIRQSGTEDTPFKGIIYRVEKSKNLFVEFGVEFYDQHYSGCKYDVKFSLNRVCLKRTHNAIEAASDVLFKNFLFPDCIPSSKNISLEELWPFHLTLKEDQLRAVHRIVMHQGPSPYLLEGPLSVTRAKKHTRDRVIIAEKLTSTGTVIQEAVLQLWKASSVNRILICTNSNSACDALMSSLQKEIPVSDIFRSNAAFRELDEVPDDILPHCPYEEKDELFSCPQLAELEKFRLILSTFLSTSRLHNEGLKPGHFSHIFLVDASSAIEPETLVPLANLANEETVIVVSGKPQNCSRWVRSSIARYNGLQRSYFERLRNSELYVTLNPEVISELA